MAEPTIRRRTTDEIVSELVSAVSLLIRRVENLEKRLYGAPADLDMAVGLSD